MINTIYPTDLSRDNLILGDGVAGVKNLPKESIHLILSDIPYGINYAQWDVLHNNTNSALGGTSPAQKNSSGGFSFRGKPINGWSEADKKIPIEYQQWIETWAIEWFRVLKPGASCFVFAGRRYSHRAIIALENSGFTFRDLICWDKGNATLKAQRISRVFERRNDQGSADKFAGWRVGNLRPTFEPILWFNKPYKQGGTISDNMLEHEVGAYNLEKWKKYVPDGSNIIHVTHNQDDRGLHPTQKPLLLMKALIELVTHSGHTVLDPFAGSGTTLQAAKELERRYIGFEIDEEYYNSALKRLNQTTLLDFLK